jgi:hypothetical protein
MADSFYMRRFLPMPLGKNSHLELTSYPATRTLVPGAGYAVKMPFTIMRPLHGESLYKNTREISTPVLNTVHELIIVNNKPTNAQFGSGANIEENDDSINTDYVNDIVPESSSKVDDKILSAFQKPRMRFDTVSFQPEKKVREQPTGL